MRHLTPSVVKGKRVLMRVDFNVEIDNKGQIVDDFRIQKILPTLRFLQDYGAKNIILISHFGQPEKQDYWTEKFSLRPVFNYLSSIFQDKINFCALKDFEAIQKCLEKSKEGTVWLLENIRYFDGEMTNDVNLAKQLAQLGDLYINEAFSVSHREAASLCAITKFLPSYPGFLLEEEVKQLNNIIQNPKPPVVIILGGAKVKDKLPLLEKFLHQNDQVLVGGVVANTILKSYHLEIGQSLFEEEVLEKAYHLETSEGRLLLPGDFVVLTRKNKITKKDFGLIEKNDTILDIGPVAALTFSRFIQEAKTIFWNGPMGKIEDSRFQKGTKAILEAIIQNKEAKTVIGGGDTLKSLKILNSKFELSDSIFLSTGGGAMMSYLAQKPLPGLMALNL